MVDMRRYIQKTAEFGPLTNLSSTVNTELEFRLDEAFDDTLGRVKATMEEKKGSNLGLNTFVKLNLIYRFLGDRIADRILPSLMDYPRICMTNVGILDSSKMAFGGLRPWDAFLCGSIKYKPYFQIAASSYDGELTLSVNLLGSMSDRSSILSFLDDIDAELSRWEQSRSSGRLADRDELRLPRVEPVRSAF
jgi:NRPS condensation-like uncharacterized protein